MTLQKAVLLGLSGFLTLALGACGGGYSTVAVPVHGTTDTELASLVTDSYTTNLVTEDAASPNPVATATTANAEAATSVSDDNPENATLSSLVGFLVTETEGEFNDYAGIAADGVLTDYTYDEANSCYDSTSTQITDRGQGLFWVQDGEVTTELRMARQNGNLVLFRNNIDEAERVVYPGTTSVSASDLPLCS